MMQANEEAVEILKCMLSWLDITQNFEELMQLWIEDDSENGEEVDEEEDFETEQHFEEP